MQTIRALLVRVVTQPGMEFGACVMQMNSASVPQLNAGLPICSSASARIPSDLHRAGSGAVSSHITTDHFFNTILVDLRQSRDVV